MSGFHVNVTNFPYGWVTDVNVSGGTTGLITTGGPITSSGTITLSGTLAVASGGTGVTTSTGTGSVVLNGSPTFTGLPNFAQTIRFGQNVTTGQFCSLELGRLRSGNGLAYMDFFTNDTGTHTTRFLREATDNGTLSIINNGTGGINTVHGTTTVVTTNSSGMSVFGTGNFSSKLSVSTDNFIANSSGVVQISSTGSNPPTIAGGMLYVTAADAQNTGAYFLSSNSYSRIILGRTNGTFAAPTAVLLNDELGAIAPRGYNGSAYSTDRGRVTFVAAENWTTTNNGSHIDFYTTANGTVTAGTFKARITESGNVLIGTTSDSGNKLQVNGTAVASSFGANGGSVSSPSIFANGDTNTGVWFPAADTMAFSTNGVERARFNSTGQFAIGNTTGDPINSKVSGAAFDTTTGSTTRFFINTDNQTPISIGYMGSTSPEAGLIIFYYNNAGTVTAVGSIGYDGTNVHYNKTSDYRLKENVTPLQNGLQTILNLSPATFTWKGTEKQSEGFIAHELEQHIPAAVSGAKDAIDEHGNIKPQMVDYSSIVVWLVAAVQELKKELDDVRKLC